MSGTAIELSADNGSPTTSGRRPGTLLLLIEGGCGGGGCGVPGSGSLPVAGIVDALAAVVSAEPDAGQPGSRETPERHDPNSHLVPWTLYRGTHAVTFNDKLMGVESRTTA